jgi:hypothetical protein
MDINEDLQSRETKRNPLRDGAILLDLFIATTLFATCLLILGSFGSQSLHIAQVNSIERLEVLAADSILAKEVATDCPDGTRTWKETIQGASVEVSVSRVSLENGQIKRITVRVSAVTGINSRRPTVTLSRLVFIGGEI